MDIDYLFLKLPRDLQYIVLDQLLPIEALKVVDTEVLKEAASRSIGNKEKISSVIDLLNERQDDTTAYPGLLYIELEKTRIDIDCSHKEVYSPNCPLCKIYELLYKLSFEGIHSITD